MKSEGEFKIYLSDHDATIELGSVIGKFVALGMLIHLAGELGTGKTTLVKGIVAGMGGVPVDVSSPTFTIVNTYETPKGILLHADMYRMGQCPLIDDTGLLDAVEKKSAAVVIEWADRISTQIERPDIIIKLMHTLVEGKHARTAIISVGKPLIDKIRQPLLQFAIPHGAK